MGADRSSKTSPNRPELFQAPAIYMETALYRQFQEICRKRDSTYSQTIRRFVRETVAEAQQAA